MGYSRVPMAFLWPNRGKKLNWGNIQAKKLFFQKKYFMPFLPPYCHSFRSTVIPSIVLSFLPDYCHSFWIIVIPSVLVSFLPNIVIIQRITNANYLQKLPIPEGPEKWPLEVAIYASSSKCNHILMSHILSCPYGVCLWLYISLQVSRIAWCLKSERLTGNSNIWVRLEWTNRFGVSDISMSHIGSTFTIPIWFTIGKDVIKYVQCVLIFMQEKNPLLLHKVQVLWEDQKNLIRSPSFFLKLFSDVKTMCEIFSIFYGQLRIS